jgi:TPR repeat protein
MLGKRKKMICLVLLTAVASLVFAESGINTKCDYAKAIEEYEKVAGTNNIEACKALARIYASCNDPRFHDGEKAVKYAGTAVSKNMEDADAVALLAAAHARNMDFRKAVNCVKNAETMTSQPEAKEVFNRMEDAYRQGEPYPPIATRKWLLEAIDRNSSWAVNRTLWKLADPVDPLYDPDKALRICQAQVRQNWFWNLTLGGLHLQAGDLKKADRCYEEFVDGWERKERDKQARAPARYHRSPAPARYYGVLARSAINAYERAAFHDRWHIRVNGMVVRYNAYDPDITPVQNSFLNKRVSG